MTRPVGDKEAVAKDMVTFLDAVKGLDMARKCMCQLDFVDYFITRSNDPKNELHRKLKFKKPKFIDWLDKYTLQIISSHEYLSLVTRNRHPILDVFSLKCIRISGSAYTGVMCEIIL